jgi:hypothetical protein
MDLHSAEQLILERHRQMITAAERRARLTPEGVAPAPIRLWAAGRLRSMADRLEGRSQLQRV